MNNIDASPNVEAYPPKTRGAFSPSNAAPGIRNVPSIDALRAFAIAPVLLVHAGVPGFAAGALGVDLFFCISGFLITTLLLNEWSNTGALRLMNFWARRFLRLMPAYYLYAAGITAAIWLWPGSIIANHRGWSPSQFTTALWFYFINYAPMSGIWNGQNVTFHLWSLAVEEQYYVLWPILLFGLLRFPRLVVPVAWALVTTAYVYFIFFASDEARSVLLYGRGISLFLASATAATWHRWRAAGIWPGFVQGRANCWLTTALIGTIFAFALSESPLLTQSQLRHFILPILLVFYELAIVRLWYGTTAGIWHVVLSNPALIYIGKISYGIYLYHEVVRSFSWWVTEPLFNGSSHILAYGVRLALYLTLSVAIAGISFKFYERRFLALRGRFR